MVCSHRSSTKRIVTSLMYKISCSLNYTQSSRLRRSTPVISSRRCKMCWFIIQRKCRLFARRRNTFQYVNQPCLLPVGCPESGPAAQLGEKAAHHSASVCKVDGHLDRQGDDPDSTERYRVCGRDVPLSICMSSTDTEPGFCFHLFLN